MPTLRSTAALVGPGLIGRIYAASLAAAGHDVTLCGRTPRDPGVIATADGARHAVPGPVHVDPATVEGPADWVLVATKAHQTAAARPWFDALVGEGTRVVVLQNGVEHRQRVAPLVPVATPVVPAIVWDWAEETEPGTVAIRGASALAVPDDEHGRALADALDGGFSQVRLMEDFVTEAWRKLLANSVVGLLVPANRRYVIFRLPAVLDLARRLAEEVVAVAQAEGAALGPGDVDALVSRLAAMPPDAGTSILYDREADRPLEWDARNGVIQRLGRAHGVPTPVSDVLVPLLQAADPPSSYPAD